MKIDDVCDYILARSCDQGMFVSLMKLHKLVYYSQAWWMARKGEELASTSFQAWVHGPVSSELQERFRLRKKGFYLKMDKKDTQPGFEEASVPKEVRDHLDAILETYVNFNGTQLEEIVCGEQPWIAARGNCRPNERCETIIDPTLMKKFYTALFEANSSRIPTPHPLAVAQ